MFIFRRMCTLNALGLTPLCCILFLSGKLQSFSYQGFQSIMSINVSWSHRTYSSPSPTAVNRQHVKVNVGLGEGYMRSYSDTDINPSLSFCSYNTSCVTLVSELNNSFLNFSPIWNQRGSESVEILDESLSGPSLQSGTKLGLFSYLFDRLVQLNQVRFPLSPSLFFLTR